MYIYIHIYVCIYTRSLLVNPSHTDESWAGRSTYLYIYIYLYMYIYMYYICIHNTVICLKYSFIMTAKN